MLATLDMSGCKSLESLVSADAASGAGLPVEHDIDGITGTWSAVNAECVTALLAPGQVTLKRRPVTHRRNSEWVAAGCSTVRGGAYRSRACHVTSTRAWRAWLA